MSAECRALVLEDDAAISQLLSTILTREHFGVRLVRSAADAIREAETNSYHLLLLDLMVAGNGSGVIQYLKTHRLDLLQAVVVLSAHPTAIQAALNGQYPEPICRFVAKPFDVAELTTVIHSCKFLCGNSAGDAP